ncbi:nitroreductase family protein [bacterium]|nr:nitroreductase family protein [bacterium]
MDLFEAIAERRSVRKFADKPVPREVIEQLLSAAVQAPSAMNKQTWAFGVVQGGDKVKELGERARLALLKELEQKGGPADFRARLENPELAVLHGAQALIVVYATSEDRFATINCCLAAENLMLAATGMGLGTCWIGMAEALLRSPEVKAEMGVPQEAQPIATLILGYPDDDSPRKAKNPPTVLYWL